VTSGSHTDITDSTAQATVDAPLRLRLKPNAPPTGHVDGAWWPRSRALTDELAALTDVLTSRLGPVTRGRSPPTRGTRSPWPIEGFG
jgi:hypothetical protein